jgi:hypothetical protein
MLDYRQKRLRNHTIWPSVNEQTIMCSRGDEEDMFKSKQRPIAIPQWEHQKLAGTLALLWGNADFERPLVAFESFLVGVGLHD